MIDCSNLILLTGSFTFHTNKLIEKVCRCSDQMTPVALIEADVRMVRPYYLMVLAARLAAHLRVIPDVVVAHHSVF